MMMLLLLFSKEESSALPRRKPELLIAVQLSNLGRFYVAVTPVVVDVLAMELSEEVFGRPLVLLIMT